MPRLTELCRTHLEGLYRSKLGRTFSDVLSDIATDNKPVWQNLSLQDFTEITKKTEDCAGLLLDPEIGLLLYILPYAETTDINEQIVRALGLRSKLLPELHYSGDNNQNADRYGAWRVGLLWLVAGDQLKKSWIAKIVEVRGKTSASEEIPLDAVFLRGLTNSEAFVSHGFPRLLLTVREVLSKSDFRNTISWLSADELVKTALENFPGEFIETPQQTLAQGIVKELLAYSNQNSDTTGKEPDAPNLLSSFRLKDFRNIRALDLDFGESGVNSRVLHGPNGTGKSGVFEALSLALFRSSHRYKLFADRSETDISGADRAKLYVQNYLRPLGDASSIPQVAINAGQYVPISPVDDAEQAKTLDIVMSGTLLSQETSREFLLMRSDELGLRVLAGYSGLANHLEDYVEKQFNEVNLKRQQFLRQLGLPASITRLDTVRDRICENVMSATIPGFPSQLVEWIEQTAALGLSLTSALIDIASNWRTWETLLTSMKDVLKRRSAENPSEDNLMRSIRGTLVMLHQTSATTRRTLSEMEQRCQKLANLTERHVQMISTWGTWVESQNVAATPAGNVPHSAEMTATTQRLNDLRKQQQQVVASGQDAKEHLEHLTQVQRYLIGKWAAKHPDDCPTCGSNHSSAGGILKVVEKAIESARGERERLLNDYNLLTPQIKETEAKLTILGKAECPISSEDQALLAEAMQCLLPEHVVLAAQIASKDERDKLLLAVQLLRRIPAAPPEVKPEDDAERGAKMLLKQLTEAEETFEAPNNWKKVKDKFTAKLSDIVARHLPNTLGALWTEIVLNLTPARWILSDPVRFDIRASRGEQKLTVTIGESKTPTLARYILNHSEIHVMGLAWFFTRYLTHGRFFNALMVLDDPAQDFDQTSFRELCRFMETIMRLHKVSGLPLTLIVMLHQEDRALAVARATGGLLNVFDWAKEQQSTLKTVALLGKGFTPPAPISCFHDELNAVGQ